MVNYIALIKCYFYIFIKNILMKLQIINGPNLNLLGIREKSIYGDKNFDEYFNDLKIKYTKLDLHYFQSNIEGELIEKIQEVGFEFDGIIINAAAYTHTSVGIGDAIKSVNSPVIEVHISNTYTREEFRHKSFLSAHVRGVILGFGLKSYDLAIESFLD
jgi:3-dehydroquinate dehydratase-2|tara:strand:- start:7070 stop:7546 length:477 start_codon:yes stop_codon:yes gene_type:complete